jgi:hypothetical protein
VRARESRSVEGENDVASIETDPGAMLTSA